MAATCQYVAVPLFAAGCALLLHLSSPTGTGACYGLYSLAGNETGVMDGRREGGSDEVMDERRREGGRKCWALSGLVFLLACTE